MPMDGLMLGFLSRELRETLSGGRVDKITQPEPDEIDTDLISAGAYVLERDVLDLIPAGREVSIEREVWPRLVGNGLHGSGGDLWRV